MSTPVTLLTARQVAARLGLSVAAVYQRAYRGGLPAAVKLGARTIRWRSNEIDALIENKETSK